MMKSVFAAASLAAVLCGPAVALTVDPVGTSAYFSVDGTYSVTPFVFFDDSPGGIRQEGAERPFIGGPGPIGPGPIGPGVGVIEGVRAFELTGSFEGAVENLDLASEVPYRLSASLEIAPDLEGPLEPLVLADSVVTPPFSLGGAYDAIVGLLVDTFGGAELSAALGAISAFLDEAEAPDPAILPLPDGGLFSFLWETTVLDAEELEIAGTFTLGYTAGPPDRADVPLPAATASVFDPRSRDFTGTYALDLRIEPAAVIPLPAGLPLLGAGLFVLWSLRRRRG